jgi:arylsulfatase A-like enzyme
MNPTRREFLKTAGAAAAAMLAASSLSGCAAAMTSASRKPNVIFILADDLGYGDLSCYGQKNFQTPTLDNMAAEGMKWSDFYAGSTVCAPSRCALLTGRDTGHATVRANAAAMIHDNEDTLGKIFQRAGYATACIGKWGAGSPCPPGDPKRNGIDYFFGYLNMGHAHNYYTDFLWRNEQKVELKNVVQHPKARNNENEEILVGLAVTKIEYVPDLCIAEALDYIDQQTKPFFLLYTPTIPHANNEANKDFGQNGMEVPDLGAFKNKDWPEPEKAKAAMITRLDNDIAKLFKKLKDKVIDENTLVILSSDNGPHAEGGVNPEFFNSSGPLRGIKRDLYEGGIRVPTIARWPNRIKAGSVSDYAGAFWDMLPTFAELTGQKVSNKIEGVSLLPTLLGKPGQVQHDYLYWEFHEGRSKQAVRMGNWKAVRLAPSKPIELYDLSKDVGEKNDIAKSHPDIVEKMIIILDKAHKTDPAWPLKDAAPAKKL